MWPTSSTSQLKTLSERTLGVHFLSWLKPTNNTIYELSSYLTNCLKRFASTRDILELSVAKVANDFDLTDRGTRLTEDQVIHLGSKFIDSVLEPLRRIKFESNENYFFVVDGIDEAFFSERLAKADHQLKTSNGLLQFTAAPLDGPEALLLFFNQVSNYLKLFI